MKYAAWLRKNRLLILGDNPGPADGQRARALYAKHRAAHPKRRKLFAQAIRKATR